MTQTHAAIYFQQSIWTINSFKKISIPLGWAW